MSQAHRCGRLSGLRYFVRVLRAPFDPNRRLPVCRCGDGTKHVHPFACADIERAVTPGVKPLVLEEC